MALVLRLAASAFALWLTTMIVSGVRVVSYDNQAVAVILTYLVVAAIFGVLNATLGVLLRLLTFPLFLLTLGLFSLVVNAVVLLAVAAVSRGIGFGLEVDGFWWAVAGSLVLSVANFLVGIIFRR